ncbi:MAG: hypothetical protein ABSE73_27250 [Planctomycetota bacterium]
MAGKADFLTYLKAVFRNRWNLLFLAGGVAASFVSGAPSFFLPLVAAAEVAFLTAVATNPRFQRALDSQTGAAEAERTAATMQRRFNQLFFALASEAQELFNQMRRRCEVLRPSGPQDPTSSDAHLDGFAQSQAAGVNKLLWVYLKLLHTKATLDHFLRTTDEDEIVNLEQTTRLRLEALPKESSDELTAKKRHSLEDTLATATARRENLKRAKENREFVELELERIAAKLTALSEMAVNRQDPERITSEVDDVARSVEGTEQAINELQAFTGLSKEDEQAPPILAMPQRVRA